MYGIWYMTEEKKYPYEHTNLEQKIKKNLEIKQVSYLSVLNETCFEHSQVISI